MELLWISGATKCHWLTLTFVRLIYESAIDFLVVGEANQDKSYLTYLLQIIGDLLNNRVAQVVTLPTPGSSYIVSLKDDSGYRTIRGYRG